MKTKKSQNIQIGFLLLPGILIFGFFTIYPIVKLFITSFFKWDFGSMFDQEFIGFANYKEVLTDPYFHLAFSNSIVYTLVTVPAQMILGLLIAMLINNINKFSISYRVAYYLPVITSWVIASLVFKYVFNTEGLFSYQSNTFDQWKYPLAGQSVGRHERCNAFGNLEGNRLEYGSLFSCLTDCSKGLI